MQFYNDHAIKFLEFINVFHIDLFPSKIVFWTSIYLFTSYYATWSQPLTSDRGWAPTLGPHTQQDWRKTSLNMRGTKNAVAYSLFREVPRAASPGALRCHLGHINRPFSRLAVVGSLGALVVFCRIKGKSSKRFRFRHEEATTGKALLCYLTISLTFLLLCRTGTTGPSIYIYIYI